MISQSSVESRQRHTPKQATISRNANLVSSEPPLCQESWGYTQDELTSMQFRELFTALPPETSAVAAIRAFAGVIVELKHRDGSPVNARMSKSALQRDDDPVALATFQDLTEQIWVEGL